MTFAIDLSDTNLNRTKKVFLNEGLFCLLLTQVLINGQNIFVPLFQHLTSNYFTLKDSFEFAKIICEHNAGLFMACLDVYSLFTNVPLEEIINICVNELFKSNSSIHIFNKKQITEMFSLATKESITFFDIAFYTQVHGVAIGSPLGLSLGNAFSCFYETK